MHRVRGASGDVLAWEPGFSPEILRFHPPETPRLEVDPSLSRGGWAVASVGECGGERAGKDRVARGVLPGCAGPRPLGPAKATPSRPPPGSRASGLPGGKTAYGMNMA